jgi:hypothetical protein
MPQPNDGRGIDTEIPPWMRVLTKKQQRQLKAYSLATLGGKTPANSGRPTAWVKGPPPIGSTPAGKGSAAPTSKRNWTCRACGHADNKPAFRWCNNPACNLRWNYWDDTSTVPKLRPRQGEQEDDGKGKGPPKEATPSTAATPAGPSLQDVDTLEKLADKLKTTQSSTATELLAQANKLRLELAALPPPEPKPPPPPEIVLPRHLAKLRRLRHNVERQQKALDKASAARDEAQAALDKQAERLASATKKLEEAEQTRLELLKALPTSGSPDEAARRGHHSAPSTPLAGTPNYLPEVVRFLGELLLPSDDDEATRMARLGGLADTLRKGLASRYADPAAMAAMLLGTAAPPPPPPEGGDDPMVTADEKETPHAGVTVRLPDSKRRKGTAPRDTSGSDADEEEAACTGSEAAPGTRRRSRTPPPANGRKTRHGPHSPATPSD